MELLIGEVPSEIGSIVFAARDGRLVAAEFEDRREPMLAGLRRRYPAAEPRAASDPFGIGGRFRAYLAGELDALDSVEVETGGTELQRRAWQRLRQIPCGSTITYTELAAAMGRPGAARAAGSINAVNPISIAVPCHRVVGTNASLTGYAGGIWRKRWLLAHEGAAVVARDGAVLVR